MRFPAECVQALCWLSREICDKCVYHLLEKVHVALEARLVNDVDDKKYCLHKAGLVVVICPRIHLKHNPIHLSQPILPMQVACSTSVFAQKDTKLLYLSDGMSPCTKISPCSQKKGVGLLRPWYVIPVRIQSQFAPLCLALFHLYLAALTN